MENKETYWYLFVITGNIEAYLLYREHLDEEVELTVTDENLG